jgi:hypothetical protein
LLGDLKLDVLMVLATKIKALWHAAPCNLGDICCLHLEGGPLKIAAVSSVAGKYLIHCKASYSKR